jgi:methylated-DNA-[protein]-cysteine S-methyltransferase
MTQAVIESPIGPLLIFADAFGLRRIVLPAENALSAAAVPAADPASVLCQAAAQLAEYFAGQRQTFNLPLSPQGTAFQQAVWAQIALIPYGQTRSYGELAARLGNPAKARAAGGAAGRNPLPIIIPCHRVIGSSGSLTGFSGGLAVKRFLLRLESGLSA